MVIHSLKRKCSQLHSSGFLAVLKLNHERLQLAKIALGKNTINGEKVMLSKRYLAISTGTRSKLLTICNSPRDLMGREKRIGVCYCCCDGAKWYNTCTNVCVHECACVIQLRRTQSPTQNQLGVLTARIPRMLTQQVCEHSVIAHF